MTITGQASQKPARNTPGMITSSILLIALFAFVLPDWWFFPCATPVLGKIANGVLAFIVLNMVVNFMFLGIHYLGPVAGFPVDRIADVLRIFLPFPDFKPVNVIFMVIIILGAVGIHYAGYSLQRSQDVMPVIKAVTVEVTGKSPLAYKSGDQVELYGGNSASFAVEMLSQPTVHCLWSAVYGTVSPGEDCKAAYVASSKKGADQIRLTVQSSCKARQLSLGISILVR